MVPVMAVSDLVASAEQSAARPRWRHFQTDRNRAGSRLISKWMRTQYYLLRLSELELLDRERRATERRIHQAKFDVVKSLDTFEFLAIPSLNKALVLDLARCEFIERKENILALGNSDPATFCTSLLRY
jgi:DNA replication protein DnaC